MKKIIIVEIIHLTEKKIVIILFHISHFWINQESRLTCTKEEHIMKRISVVFFCVLLSGICAEYSLAQDQPPENDLAKLPIWHEWKNPPLTVGNQVTARGKYKVQKRGVKVDQKAKLFLLPLQGGQILSKLGRINNMEWGPVLIGQIPNGTFGVCAEIEVEDRITKFATTELLRTTIKNSFNPPQAAIEISWGQGMPDVMGNKIIGEGTYTINNRGYKIQKIEVLAIPLGQGTIGTKGIKQTRFADGKWAKAEMTNVPAGD